MSLLSADRYTYRVIWSEEDQRHVALVDEFPSLSYLAPTIIDAMHGMMKMVTDVLADMEMSQESPPRPGNRGAILDWVNSDLRKMARDIIEQADTILDEDANASQRRVLLLRASSHLINAFAELEELSDVKKV